MCGICGIVHQDRERPVDRDVLAGMNDQLRFRGPDAEGYFQGAGMGFGHRRLSVIDLEGGLQPMSDPEGRVTVSFNGEIYNFQKLREELIGAGADFSTQSDTEVLIWGYRLWGPDFVRRLAGMFAFALWDAREETLLLVRDRLGVKPLCWASLPGGGLAFASEVTALLAHPEIEAVLNVEAAVQMAALSYVCRDEAVIEGVHKLPPASMLTYRRGRAPEVSTYWDLAGLWSAGGKDQRTDAQLVEAFAQVLGTAVECRLVSDVPLGAFLSGGLDSSTVCAYMRERLPRVETFSIGFEEAGFSELAWAGRASRSLGTTHFEKTVRGDDPDLLVEIVERLDEPFADTSIVPTYILCKAARERVTVALSGDGGDEVLAGYVTHQADALHSRLHRLPAGLWSLAGKAVGLIPDRRGKVDFLFKAKQFIGGLGLNPKDAHAWWRTLMTPDRIGELFGRDYGFEHIWPAFARAYEEAGALSDLDRFLYVDYRTWLLHDILYKADRASMAHGLEVRSPFLDHRLIEFCAGLPDRLKLHRGKGKQVLRKAARGKAPDEVIDRKKEGFNAPVAHWLQGPWRELMGDVLGGNRLRQSGLIDPDAAGRIMNEHLSKKKDHGFVLFSLLMLALWMERIRPSIPGR